MTFVSGYRCTVCHTTFPASLDSLVCPKCGDKGILDVLYDYDAMKEVVTKEYFSCNTRFDMLRYQPMMSIQETKEAVLSVGWTPLYRSFRLGNTLGVPHLYLKDETVNPSGSLKDRASLVACLKAIEQGQQTICCSSTGNAASSLAGNAAKLGLDTIIVVPDRSPIGKRTQMVMYNASILQVQGDYKAAYEVSKSLISNFHFYNRNAAVNPHLVEGKKTVALEILEQLHFQVPDYMIVSVGDGCTIAGVYKGCFDLLQLGLIDHLPTLIGVQAEGCAPFVTAFETNAPLQEAEENTFADSIAVGIPRNPVKGMDAVRQTGGFYLSVTDDEIRYAMRVLGETEGLFAEPAGATGLAGLIKMQTQEEFNPNATYVVLVTGNGLKDPGSVQDYVKMRSIAYHPNTDDDLLHSSNDIDDLLQQLTERRTQHE